MNHRTITFQVRGTASVVLPDLNRGSKKYGKMRWEFEAETLVLKILEYRTVVAHIDIMTNELWLKGAGAAKSAQYVRLLHRGRHIIKRSVGTVALEKP